MNPIRLLPPVALLALSSCSGFIQESGRDPMKLVGRSQASIHAEFGKPLKAERLRGYYDSVEYFHVTGSWQNELATMSYTLGTLYSFGVLEPIFTVTSAYSKHRDTSQGMHLVVSYRDRVVAKAMAASINRNSPINWTPPSAP